MRRAGGLESLPRSRQLTVTNAESDTDLRDGVLWLAIAGGVVLAVITEALGAIGRLTFWPLALAWIAALALGVLLARRRGLRLPSGRPGLELGQGLDLATAVWIGILVVVTGALALAWAPTAWDSMTYHLARVAHWIQDRSIAVYPTHIRRQLYQPPWAEFVLLHLVMLGRGDRLVNLLQWGSMLGSLVGVSVIARQLGAGTRGQLVSAFVCATIPMGIMQATTTQNDYVVALWLVCLASTLLALDARPGIWPALGAGASFGLALLTKGTAYTLATPMIVAFLFGGRSRPWRRTLAYGLVIVGCAAVLNAPHYARNVQLFGSPLGPGGEGGDYTYLNREISAPIFGSNIVRNVGLHVGTPWSGVNAAVERAVEGIHRGIGIASDDARSTWPTTRFVITAPAASEDQAGNGLHLLLLVAALVWACGPRASGRMRALGAALVVAFLLFALFLRWQPWHSRIQLPLFVLGAPLVAVAFERVRSMVLGLVLLILAASSAYFLVANRAHPFFGRGLALGTAWTDERQRHAGPAYVGAARFLASSGCRQAGLALSSNDPEYFLWGLLADAGWRGRLEAVLVANESADLPYRRRAFRPCAIVRVGSVWGPAGAGLTLGEQYFAPVWSQGEIQILFPAPRPPAQSVARSGPPVARLVLERSRFEPGDRVTIGLVVRNPLNGIPADLYIGLVLPDGRSAMFVGPSGLLSDAIGLADANAYPRASVAAPGFSLDTPKFTEFTVPLGMSPGTYEMFAQLVKRRLPRGQRIPPEDVVASDLHRVVLSP